ncbi:MAG: CoB--CoM heterodisulfide reductase iron-sulfur subunit A family protein [Candidatus Methanoperedens sp.]|nr:CoB--CoM heterodisulfide reductase iron-sulfur subunit A family protein [Candidatus Methanoperedens sp.]
MMGRVGAVAVIGSGIAGIQSALDLADGGFRVYLIDSKTTIGGRMAQLDKTFPTLDCAMCIVSPKLVEASRHPNIDLLLYSQVTSVSGTEGNFKLKLLKKARYVEEDKCTGCGLCVEKCPSKVADEYNAGLSMRKAIYLSFPQAVPRVMTIDAERCLFLTKGKCGVCKKVCTAGAVNYEQKDREIELDVGSIILATGFTPFDPLLLKQYRPTHPDVITSMQFERILSASGPTQGHVLRPSDGRAPKYVGFIQCIGSRNPHIGRSRCSSVCCMQATKEAIIAKEHDPNLDITIFNIDIRAFGKGFEEFYMRAQKEYGIRFISSRPPEVQMDSSGKIFVRYEDMKEGRIKNMPLDLVVLSVGLDPSPETKKLAQMLGLDLDEFGNVASLIDHPLETSAPGIHACGVVQGPKDIPDTVAQGSGAAAKASALLATERGTLVKEKIFPPERAVPEMPRIGVMVCHCGINIGSIVNVPSVIEYAKTLPNVVHAEEAIYACSRDNQEKIKILIQEKNLNRFIVASCTPRTHEQLFQNTLKEAALNPFLFEFANIREHCSWVHMNEKEKATVKAKDIVRMAAAKSSLLAPLTTSRVSVTQKALVIGGGIAGMTCALDIANNGFPVYLIEKEDMLGGLLRHVTGLEDGRKSSDIIAPLIRGVMSHPRIQVFTGTLLADLKGYVGNFEGILDTRGTKHEIKFGAAVIATGAKELVPSGYYNYGSKNIITQLQLENSLENGFEKVPGNVVMIQCAGARIPERPYCSRTCCVEAVKNAIRVKKQTKSSVYVLYRDMRTYGVWEKLYREASGLGVVFLRYSEENPPIVKDNIVTVHDLLIGDDIEIEADSIVLSCPMVAPESNAEMAKLFKIPLDRNGFFLEAHAKLRPVEFATSGVLLCGTAQAPKLIDEGIAQASGAAAKVCVLLSKEEMETDAMIAAVDEKLCIGCGTCIKICPFNAPQLIDVEVKAEEMVYLAKKSRINPAMCKGCGSCAASCPVGAISPRGFTSNQIKAVINAFGSIPVVRS